MFKSAVTPITTLLPGWLWLRADEQPYFHQYVQSVNAYAPGDVILGSYTTGGQYQIVNGQIEAYLPNGKPVSCSSPDAVGAAEVPTLSDVLSGSLLYVNVKPPANSSVTYIGKWGRQASSEFDSY